MSEIHGGMESTGKSGVILRRRGGGFVVVLGGEIGLHSCIGSLSCTRGNDSRKSRMSVWGDIVLFGVL